MGDITNTLSLNRYSYTDPVMQSDSSRYVAEWLSKAVSVAKNAVSNAGDKALQKVSSSAQKASQGYSAVASAAGGAAQGYRSTQEYIRQRTEEVRQKVISFSCGTAEKVSRQDEGTMEQTPETSIINDVFSGFFVALVKGVVLNPYKEIGGALEKALFGRDDAYQILAEGEETLEQYVINTSVDDISAYNIGKVIGDIASVAVGFTEIGGGVSMMYAGVNSAAGGVMLSATGVGTKEGIGLIIEGGAVAAGGAAVIGLGSVTAVSGLITLFGDAKDIYDSASGGAGEENKPGVSAVIKRQEDENIHNMRLKELMREGLIHKR